MQPKSIEALIVTLAEEGVEFVVIGGMAAVLHGAPVVTKDLDIVHRRTPENIAKLLAILHSVDAHQRADSRRLPPTESALSGRGLNLTRHDATRARVGTARPSRARVSPRRRSPRDDA